MKVVFVSNYFNHHQKPFCDEMYQRLGNGFSFISTAVMREERKKLGYAHDDHPAYVLLAYEGVQQRKEAIALINNADVVIAGSAPAAMFFKRIRMGKLFLRYSERPFKKKTTWLKRIYHFISLRRKDLWKKNIYMLCAGAYVAGDYASIGMYKNRTYKWGYFPEVKRYDTEALQSRKKRNTLMWCGRFIDWKHPDDVIKLAHKLKAEGYDFCLNLVGTGVMEEELRQLVAQLELADCVYFLGSMSPDQVRRHMEEAGIYLFTSDRQEGWGAVLNEAMNSGCAVVASHAIGSAPFLISDNENGLVYESGNLDDLFNKVKYMLDNHSEQSRIGRAAYSSITKLWNAEVVVERFVKFTEQIKDHGYCDLYKDGPCSKA